MDSLGWRNRFLGSFKVYRFWLGPHIPLFTRYFLPALPPLFFPVLLSVTVSFPHFSFLIPLLRFPSPFLHSWSNIPFLLSPLSFLLPLPALLHFWASGIR
jgi:hypothetical protein